ncbi:MAG: hypothetical protein IKV59_08200 [Lachnospiraceae bacterium]|nr:hypothetical protein [Lachnospiraceae bacterium]
MFKEGTCPKCRETIQVPEDRETILCMYCGQEIRVDEVLGKKKQFDIVRYGECYNRAMLDMKDMIRTCEDPVKRFKKDSYEGEFERFHSSHREMYEAIAFVYQNDEQPDRWLQKLADLFVSEAKSALESCKNKGKKNQLQLDMNLMLGVYLIPSIRKYPAKFSEQFADCIVTTWNRELKASVGKSSFDDIESGFHKKLCYITTAVCESIGKGLDCYELTLLKQYRDEHLEMTQEGHELVEDYYNIAPTIVKRIEKRSERDQIYGALYQNYILPCVEMIEEKKYDACREQYEKMVLELKAEYIS